MIKLNAKDDRVEVTINGTGKDIARELHALLGTIQDSEAMQAALMIAIAADEISEEKQNEKFDEIREMLKRLSEKEKNNGNIKSQ